MIVLVAAQTEQESDEVKGALLTQLVEYIFVCKIELLRGSEKDPQRKLELASYLTFADIRNSHKFQMLKLAMKAHYAAENFITASHFCR